MRTLEWLIVAVLAAYVLTPGLRRRPMLLLAAVAAVLAHLLVEGYRWQMVPLYAAVALLVARSSLRLARRLFRPAGMTRTHVLGPRTGVRGPWRRWTGLVAGLALLAVMSGPPVLFPVQQLPEPGGASRIGTTTFEWTDEARLEAYSPAPDDRRRLMVQVWYPALPPDGATPAPWMDHLDVMGPQIAGYLRLPGYFLDHADLVATNDYTDAPPDPVGGPYPVVLYSHGWNGFRAINLNQSEALASRGYIAVAVDHTYGAMVTVFENGETALNNPAAIPTGVPDAEYQRAITQLEATYAGDLSFVLDQLERLNAGVIPSPLAGRLDLTRIGVYGHSTGGGATVVMCAADPRCTAALGMDPWLEPVPGEVIEAGLAQPFLAMMSQTWSSPANDALVDRLLGAGSGDRAKMTIAGTGHYDFTLLPLLTPLAPALGLKGPIDGQRGMQIVTENLVGFFDRYLKSGGIVNPAMYPEVTFETR